jgi:hypothetical protein
MVQTEPTTNHAGPNSPLTTGAEPSAPVLTARERQVLQRLNDLGHRTAAPFGVNPISFGGERASACARRMAAKGWVRLDRISQRHIRYGITGAGRLVLNRDTQSGEP